ncbi:MAG: exodeoxyribonuclease III [Alphaproteobacteria bacterium]|nr:exodeoxyribonuclease III [Alphaproteobacteria bacterium]
MEESVKISSWNVNSIKARLDHVKRYLQEQEPDILMLQELKGLDFPYMEFEAIGYHSHAVTQKAYNGVAIISRFPINIVLEHLPGDKNDEQARYLEADISGLRIINIYLPNGNPAPGPKYDYKLAWMQRLYTHLKSLRDSNIPFLVGGDFNVILDDKDCYNPEDWEKDALFLPQTKAAFRSLLHLGLYDALRMTSQAPEQYTFWDYQRGSWQNNEGLRIDHFLLSPFVADMMQECHIDTTPRNWDKPSDHTPISLKLTPHPPFLQKS